MPSLVAFAFYFGVQKFSQPPTICNHLVASGDLSRQPRCARVRLQARIAKARDAGGFMMIK
jgi:hypothetical protein